MLLLAYVYKMLKYLYLNKELEADSKGPHAHHEPHTIVVKFSKSSNTEFP